MANEYEESFFGLESAPKKSVPKKRIQPPIQVELTIPMATTSFNKRAKTRDYTMESAIRICAPILHPDELGKYKSILDPLDDESLKTRVLDWRQRNGISKEHE